MTKPRTVLCRDQSTKGMALVIVLWISALLSSIALAGAYLARLELRQTNYPVKEMQLLAAALAGVERAKAALIVDTNTYDSLKEPWKRLDNEPLQLNTITVTISVVDEESKFNLNMATRGRLERFSPLTQVPNADELIDSLIDWEDAGTQPLPSGAENNYYAFLKPPRACKNAALDCIEEVSLVRGFSDPAILRSLKRFATVYSSGKININTAPLETLMTLPGVDYLLAQGIIARRNGPDLKQGTEDDVPYNTTARVEEVVGRDVFTKIDQFITVSSSHFQITVTARSGSYNKTVETVVSRQGRSIRTKYWKEL